MKAGSIDSVAEVAEVVYILLCARDSVQSDNLVFASGWQWTDCSSERKEHKKMEHRRKEHEEQDYGRSERGGEGMQTGRGGFHAGVGGLGRGRDPEVAGQLQCQPQPG